jgi:hypothetical protein
MPQRAAGVNRAMPAGFKPATGEPLSLTTFGCFSCDGRNCQWPVVQCSDGPINNIDSGGSKRHLPSI